MVLPYYLVLGVEHCGLKGAWCVQRSWGPEWELIDPCSRLLPLFRPTRTSFTVLEYPLGGGCKNRARQEIITRSLGNQAVGMLETQGRHGS